MRSTILSAFCLLAAQATMLPGMLPAADSLFSNVPIDSVFSPSGSTTPTNSVPERPYTPPPTVPNVPNVTAPASPSPSAAGKALELESLAEMLKQAGFETKDVGERTLSTKTKIDTWSFPVIASLTDDQKHVAIVLLLSVVKDEKQIPVEKLLNLMSTNRQIAPAYFSFSTKHKRTELYRTLSSQELTSDLLKEEVARLATIAKDNHALWNFASATPPAVAPPTTPPPSTPLASSPTTPAPTPAAKTPKTPAPTSPLVGKWSAASSSTEGFALLLTNEGKFTLVHVANGKQSRSTGTFTHQNQQLTLNGNDGVKLTGAIAAQTDQAFQFTLNAKSNKPAVLAFKRAK